MATVGAAPAGGTTPNGGIGGASVAGTASGGARDCGTLIDDMEDGTGFICQGDGRRGAWYTFGPEASIWPVPKTPGTPIETTKIDGTRGNSKIGMHFFGSAAVYAGIGIDLNYDGVKYGSYDARPFGGISFWARGSTSGIFRVRLSTIETTSTEYGGTCTLEDPPQALGCQPHKMETNLTSEWSRYWVPFAALPVTSQSSSRDLVFRPDQLTNVQFYLSGAFDLWIDDIAFFVGAPGCCQPLAPGCDANLANMTEDLKEILHTPTGKANRCEDVCFIQQLDPPYLFRSNSVLDSLEGLQCAVGLRRVLLSENLIADLTPLANNNDICDLDLGNNQIEDISALGAMRQLRILKLNDNSIEDLTPLTGLVAFEEINLECNRIKDVTALGGATDIKTLRLGANEITDINPLSALTRLSTLSLHSNQIADVSPLASMTELTALYLSENRIVDLSPLSGLTSLKTLQLDHNSIDSVQALSGLATLSDLNLESNPISDLSPIARLTSLSILRVAQARITDLGPISALSALRLLDVSHNAIASASAIAQCAQLNQLNLSYNQITDLSFLESLSQLTELWLEGNLVSKLDPLLGFDWIMRGSSGSMYSRKLVLSKNPIDCETQAATIAALRAHVTLIVDCP